MAPKQKRQKILSSATKVSNPSKTGSHSILLPRFKAFVTDLFMIYTPLLYIMTYLVLGSAQSFRENQGAIFICIALYGLISSAFFSAKGQTPGYKYVGLFLQTRDGKNVSFFLALIRFFIWLFSMSLVIGLLFPFFHPQRLALHDLICKTKVLQKN